MNWRWAVFFGIAGTILEGLFLLKGPGPRHLILSALILIVSPATWGGLFGNRLRACSSKWVFVSFFIGIPIAITISVLLSALALHDFGRPVGSDPWAAFVLGIFVYSVLFCPLSLIVAFIARRLDKREPHE